jgi:hypothetical protein
MQKQPMEFRVTVVLIERVERQPFKNRPVVFRGNSLGHDLQRIHRFMNTCLVIENRAIKLFFRRKVSKHHGLRNAGRQGDFLGRGAAKSALRK